MQTLFSSITQKITHLLGALLFLGGAAIAQAPMPTKHIGELQHELNKLQVLGSVLYVAAHPDDENTRLIAYLAGQGYRVRYLSLTRGDGGQNLIGDEKGPLLGMLRTQELLAARRIDGGEQRFSRALDFGYSKNPEETLEIWDREKVLGDVVWAIRQYRPDVIITRFATPERGGGGHGHHTASAMLAGEAFKLAADPNAYPEQLKWVEPWQATRILWNLYTWRRYQPSEEDKKKIISMNIDEYNPLLGKGYGEIASEARSMHKCQAFGTWRLRGESIDRLLHIDGDLAKDSLFERIDTKWSRVPNSGEIGPLLAKAKAEFQPTNPAAIVPTLLKAYQAMTEPEMELQQREISKKSPVDPWVAFKREQLKELILRCAGLYFEANSDSYSAAQGDSVWVTASVIKRSQYPVYLKDISWSHDPEGKLKVEQQLPLNGKLQSFQDSITLTGFPVTQPYWLEKAPEHSLFQVEEQTLIGLPENPSALYADFHFQLGQDKETDIVFRTPVVHKYVDRAIGELYRPFIVSPKLSLKFEKPVYLFTENTAQQVNVVVKALGDVAKSRIRLELPEGWKAEPSEVEMNFEKKGTEKTLTVTLTPPTTQSDAKLKIVAELADEKISAGLTEIAYNHIPTQSVFLPAETKIVRIDLEKKGTQVGYLVGSGDEIPSNLEQIGYDITLLKEEDFNQEKLSQFDAIIAGIRAYNTQDRISFYHDQLMEYVENGGTYIVQYNTSYSLKTDKLGPYPLKISRGRVTREEAKIDLLAPKHPIFNTPNKITAADFEGWVQERGLYYPGEWDERYQALTASHDPGEDPLKGALLYAQHGKGHFVYCAFSMFRELPAGVPGAYRLFSNMISLGQ